MTFSKKVGGTCTIEVLRIQDCSHGTYKSTDSQCNIQECWTLCPSEKAALSPNQHGPLGLWTFLQDSHHTCYLSCLFPEKNRENLHCHRLFVKKETLTSQEGRFKAYSVMWLTVMIAARFYTLPLDLVARQQGQKQKLSIAAEWFT